MSDEAPLTPEEEKLIDEMMDGVDRAWPSPMSPLSPEQNRMLHIGVSYRKRDAQH